MKFIDVAHLYPNANCLLKRKQNEFSLHVGKYNHLIQQHNVTSIEWIKPVLKPLKEVWLTQK